MAVTLKNLTHDLKTGVGAYESLREMLPVMELSLQGCTSGGPAEAVVQWATIVIWVIGGLPAAQSATVAHANVVL